MKDLEKIKSEDLGCQVADANPGNFAIEQEVAQLVGATVPAPTEPSADDARELGAQLLVFLRRALTPIQSALRTALADIYAHLDSRCTDYTPAAYAPYIPRPYDPMGLTPRTLPNLLTAITAFAPRKISNGGATNDGIKDGESLGHIIMGSYSNVTEIKDDNAWGSLTRDLKTLTDLFPNAHKITLGMNEISNRYIASAALNGITEFNAPNLQRAIYCNVDRGFRLQTLSLPQLTIYRGGNSSTSGFIGMVNGDTTVTKIECPKMKEFYFGRFAVDCTALEEVVTGIETYDERGGHLYMIINCPNLKRLVFGTVHTWLLQEPAGRSGISDSANLIDIEFGAGTDTNIDLRSWNPTNVLADADKTATFLQNFREHIALRLTDQGSGLTLTLSQAVFDTIWNGDGTPKSTDPDSVIYQINSIIKTDKHWSVNRA